MAEEMKRSCSTQLGVAVGSVVGFMLRGIVAAGVVGGPMALMRMLGISDENQMKITHGTTTIIGLTLLIELCTEKVPADDEFDGFLAGMGQATRYPVAAIRAVFCPRPAEEKPGPWRLLIVHAAREGARRGAMQAIEAQAIGEGIEIEGIEEPLSPYDFESLEAGVTAAAKAGAIKGINEARRRVGYFFGEQQVRGASAGADVLLQTAAGREGIYYERDALQRPLLDAYAEQGAGVAIDRSQRTGRSADDDLVSIAVRR